MPRTYRLYQAIEVVLILVGITWLVSTNAVLDVWLLIVWDVLAFGYCLTRWLRVRAHRDAHDEDGDGDGVPDWLHSLLGRRLGFAAIVLISVMGMSAGVVILVARTLLHGGQAFAVVSVVLQVLGAIAVVMAWLLLHFGYADRYAHLYYQSPAKPALGFPETKRPNLLDFAYFSFTIGSSFAASDVEVRSRSIRYTVMTHGVLSFFYNTAILGMAIGVVTGI
jgi:hypothetical protein